MPGLKHMGAEGEADGGPTNVWTARLVGRELEVHELERELRRTEAGTFRCVLLVGEPGVGKTRLTGELLRRARRRAIVLSARGYPLGASVPLAPWAEALERHLRGLESADVRRLAGGFLDDLAGLLHSVA
ncbi:MAG TPA: ATP-binding protein, partial [Acidimicrobiales bacterium]|nr:ATP-binding protein [Acidimicrobiales bacterium]